MTVTGRGFCLLEALVSVLVLSIGLLGLAQLQARLWTAASELHSDNLAYRLARSELERSLYTLGAATGGAASTTLDLVTPATVFHAVTTPATAPGLLTIGVVVSWDDRSATRSTQLQSSIAYGHLYDARWLLSFPLGNTAHPQNTAAHRQPAENTR